MTNKDALNQKELITAWVTKYALSTGVFKIQGHNLGRGMFGYRRGNGFEEYAHGKDWHTDRDAAVLRANEMLKAKIKSLKKQITKLENTDFNTATED